MTEPSAERAPPSARRPGAWYHHWLLPIVVFALAWLIVAWCFRPPPPRGPRAPEQLFSAARAQKVLQDGFGDEIPHPVGSPHNAEVRARLVAQLEQLGLSPKVQDGFACRGSGICAEVHNIVAVIEGSGEVDDALLLCAHYDSVGAGPGIGDDASGVATVIEVARAVLAGPRPQHDVVLLLDDGEEAGLLGAKAFMYQHPLARRVRVAINLEARGSSGPSLMFESAGQPEQLLNVLETLDKPFASSLFVEVYKSMPNDTNFTVFQRQGLGGFNLAYIDGVAHYHTPLDNIANNSAASLQHQGDNALSLVRALDQQDLKAFAAQGGRQRVWFDWLGAAIWSVSAETARALAVGLLVALLFMVAVWGWRPERRGATFLKALLGFLVTLAIPALIVMIVVELAKQLKGTQTPWMGSFTPYIVMMVAAAAIAVTTVGRWMRSARGWLIYALLWTQWAGLGVLVAEIVPAAAYLFIWPTAVAVLCGVIGVFARREERTPWGRTLLTLPLFFTVTVWGPVALGLVQAAALYLYPVVVLAFMLPLTCALPAIASQPPRALGRPVVGLGVLAALSWLISLVSPAFDAQAPQRMSIAHLQPVQGEAHWLVDASWGELSSAIVAAGSLGSPERSPLPNAGVFRVAMGPAPRFDAAEPPKVQLRTVESTPQSARATFRITSPRRSHIIALLIPQQVRLLSVRVDDHAMGWRALPNSTLWENHRLVAYLSAPPEGLDVQLAVQGTSGLRFEVLDIAPGLPPQAEPLLAARGERGTASQDGDLSIYSVAVTVPQDQLQ